MVYNGNYPFTVMGFTSNVVKIKANQTGILPQGLAEELVNFTFKGSTEDIGEAQVSVEIMATVKAKIKEKNSETPPPYLANLSLLVSTGFGQSADDSGLGFTTTQVNTIRSVADLAVQNGGFVAALKASVEASADSISFPDTFSVKRSVSAQLSYTTEEILFAQWVLSGNVSAMWGSLSTNTPTVTATGQVSLTNVDTGSKTVDMLLSAAYFKIISESIEFGSFSSQQNTSILFGFKWTFN